MSAREIGKELDISRNAVYQQIQSLRRKGVLEQGYTPSGMPAREQGTGTEPVSAQLARLIAEHADALERMAHDLRKHIG